MNPPTALQGPATGGSPLTLVLATLEAVQTGLCLCDEAGAVQWANSALGLSLGRSASDLPGLNLAAALHAEQARADVAATLGRALVAPQTLVFQHSDGAAVHLRLQARRAESQLGLLWLTVVDVSAEVQALQISQATLDGLTAHLCVLDEVGRILAVNRAWELFGQTQGDPAFDSLGMNYLAVCDRAQGLEAQEIRRFAAGLREVLAGRLAVFEFEYPCHSKGEQRWFLAVASRLSGPGPLRVVVAHQPVTQLKQVEARERTAQKMQALGTLAGGIAHDFNNVLAAVLGNVALAQRQLAVSHPVWPAVDRILSASLKARELVRQILAFSRNQPRAPQVQALQPLLQDMWVLLRATAPAGVLLHLQVPAEPLPVRVQATEVQQLLMNLCTNAWQALQGRSGRVDVVLDMVHLDADRARQLGDLAAGPHACLSVIDTGVGIPQAHLSRIFEPFFTTKRAGQGTGLGLAVVHGVVRNMRGAVQVQSQPGLGSIFCVYLPALPAAALGKRHKIRLASESAPLVVPVAASQAGRLLIVDDDDTVAITFQALLELAGWQVTRYDKASQALLALQAAPTAFDVVLTDHNMPEMSGLEFTEQLLRLRPGMPVVMVTGYISEELHSQAVQIGVKMLLPKESAFMELSDALQWARQA